jgi:diguanylate cyclase (GGDEF)-like protein
MNDKLITFRSRLNAAVHGTVRDCNGDDCYIQTDISDPIVGNIAESFNSFITTIRGHFQAEVIATEFLEQLKAAMQLSDVAEIVIRAFSDYFGAQAGCILSYERGQFALVKSLHMAVDPAVLNGDSLERLMMGGTVWVAEDLPGQHFRLDVVIGQFVPKHVAFIPLRYQEQHIGLCVLVSSQPFKRDFTLMESRNFVNHATPFLHNRTLIRRLEQVAAIDELTGMLNRRYGMKRLNEEFERARRHTVPLSVAMVDLDNFKKLNDTFGHQCGDYVIRDLARAMEETLRVSDFTMRYGGEEFLVVLPGASVSDAVKILDRVRRSVESRVLPFGAYEIRYTFTAGVCSYPAPAVDAPEILIARADRALYVGKRAGKNRVVPSDTSHLVPDADVVDVPAGA